MRHDRLTVGWVSFGLTLAVGAAVTMLATSASASTSATTVASVRTLSLVAGIVATEIRNHTRPQVREQVMQRFASGVEPHAAEDIADAIGYIVTRPRRVAINELLIRPTEQEA